jgi:hypothetical protein
LYHGCPQLKGNIPGQRLVGRVRSRYKQHLIQTGCLTGLFGYPQMGQMDRVKGAAEQTEPY